MKYTDKLKILYNQLTDPFERTVFYWILYAYAGYLKGTRATKQMPKTVLLRRLCDAKLLSLRPGKTWEEQLPDDRRLREVARDLLKRGYPILSDSKTNGYYIVDSIDEVTGPRAENESRAKAILSVNKGYDRVAKLIAYDLPLDGKIG